VKRAQLSRSDTYRRHIVGLICTAVLLAAALLAGLVIPGPAQAIDAFYNIDGVAIEGTDPVAYFSEGKPVEGEEDITYDYGGVTWRFASAANRDAFAADPARYAPQYGGYCAWAVSQGYTASTVREAWHIEDGKLYLNYSKGVQSRWQEDIPGHISQADANWPGLKGGN
jgi:YHS domain-containing protein